MADITTELFTLVNNNEYVYYKLLIDNISYFDRFCQEIERLSKEKNALVAIIGLMEDFSASLMLPKEKFRQIKNLSRNDVFEFKKKNVRVYVVKDEQEKTIYIVMGGLKNNQDKDIEKLKNRIKGFKD